MMYNSDGDVVCVRRLLLLLLRLVNLYRFNISRAYSCTCTVFLLFHYNCLLNILQNYWMIAVTSFEDSIRYHLALDF